MILIIFPFKNASSYPLQNYRNKGFPSLVYHLYSHYFLFLNELIYTYFWPTATFKEMRNGLYECCSSYFVLTLHATALLSVTEITLNIYSFHNHFISKHRAWLYFSYMSFYWKKYNQLPTCIKTAYDIVMLMYIQSLTYMSFSFLCWSLRYYK